MAASVELYAATLSEVRRQAAQLSRLGSTSSSGSASGGRGSGSGSADAEWVVLESSSAPAQLPSETGCSLWPQQQWQIAYEILFCQCPAEVSRLRPHQADDMLFFVYTDEAAAAAKTRLFVRRRSNRQQALPPDLQRVAADGSGGSAGAAATSSGASASGPAGASKAALVDWRASLLLMLVLQTAYRLSVVTAGDPDLLSAFVDPEPGSSDSGGGSGSGSGSSGVAEVTKVVHASPSRVLVNLDNSRSDAGRPQVSYPDICFAVDTSDDAFQSQMLKQPADCYCVLLHADVASSWRLPAGQAGSGDGGGGDEGAVAARGLQQASRPAETAAQDQLGSVIVFSGYVSHQQLTAALGSQLLADPVRQVLRAAAAATRGQQQQQQSEQQALATCRVSMRGPGEKGAADVAVSSYAPVGDTGHLAGEAAAGSAGPGRPKLFQRVQLLARGMAAAAKQAAAGPTAGSSTTDVAQLQLKCALQTLMLPVDMLADAILQAQPLAG